MSDEDFMVFEQAQERKRCALQLAGLRAENVLLKYYAAKRPSKLTVKENAAERDERVLAHFNGHAVQFKELMEVTGLNPNLLRCSIERLQGKKLLVNPRYGQYMRAAAMALLLVCVGCVTATKPIVDVGQTAVAHAATVPTAATATAVAPTPTGESITLQWDASPDAVDSYRIYSTTNQQDWREAASTTGLSVVITNVSPPVWFAAVSVKGMESEFSNIVGWTGNESVVTITAESSPDLSTWSDYAQIFTGTNVTGMQFFRTRANTVIQRVIEP